MIITRAARIAMGVALGIGIVAAIAPDNDPGEETTTIPAGTTIIAALEQDLSTGINRPGDEFDLRTVRPVQLSGGMEIPEGSVISGEVTDATDGGQNAGPPALGVRFTELVIDGDDQEIAIETEQYRFGTLALGGLAEHVILPAGRRITIRLSRPVTVEYRPGPEPIHSAE
jgi:hypothetical protein